MSPTKTKPQFKTGLYFKTVEGYEWIPIMQPKFSAILATAFTNRGLMNSLFTTLRKNKLESWDPKLIEIGPQQVCRGMTISQFNKIVEKKSISQESFKGVALDVEHSDIGRQVIRGGDPNLLSFTPSLETANLYGANRYWLPQNGVIVVGCLPAVFTDISEQAKLCPQMCSKEQKQRNQAIALGETYRLYDSLAGHGVAELVMECNEICAVVGRQKGVIFDNLYPIDSFIQKVYHVIGSGRTHLGLIPSSSCLVETFINPHYIQRAFAVKIVLTKNPVYLDILNETMKRSGLLKPDQRVLTPDDVALIMDNPRLRKLATAPASHTGTIIVDSLPKEAFGSGMLAFVEELLNKEIGKNSQENNPTLK